LHHSARGITTELLVILGQWELRQIALPMSFSFRVEMNPKSQQAMMATSGTVKNICSIVNSNRRNFPSFPYMNYQQYLPTFKDK